MASVKKKKVSLKSKTKGKNNPSPDAISYNGPVVDPPQRMARDVTVFDFQWNASLASSAGGVIDAVIDNDPAGGFSASYNTVKGYFVEVRCLALEVTFCPNNKFYAPATTTYNPVFVATVHSSSIAPWTSYDEAAENVNCIPESLMCGWKRTIKMVGSDESSFQRTNATSARFSVKMYGNGLSNSTSYGRVLVRGRFQFMDRGFI